MCYSNVGRVTKETFPLFFSSTYVIRAAFAVTQEQQKASSPDRKRRQSTADSIAVAIKEEMGSAWPGAIYRDRILPLRTRSHPVFAAAKGADVEIQHTLLGIELKVGRRRKSCPDLPTARYLSVFARAGVSEVAVPYDITKISQLADELESSWHRMLLLAAHLTEGRAATFERRVVAAVIATARMEIEDAGPGTAIPEFNQNTSQRKRRTNWRRG
jgi:hypothetical protein